MSHSVPVVAALPVIGSLADLTSTRLRAFLTGAYLTHGPVFEVRALGTRLVVLAGPEANLYAAGEGRRHFGSHLAWQELHRHFGVEESMTNVDGAGHAARRRVEGRAYTRAHFLTTLDRSVAVAEEDLAGIEPGWLRVAPWCKRLVTEQVARVAVGGSARPYLDDLVGYIQVMLMATVTHQRPPGMLGWPSIRRAESRVREMVDGLIEERRRIGPGAVPDLVDDLLAATESHPLRYGPRDVRLAVLGAFIAGMDTAANTLAFAIHEMVRHPGLTAVLVDEADAALAGGVTAASLQRLPAMTRFLHEVLRVHPIAPALRRHLVTDIEFAGHRLAAGTPVLVATTVTHGLPELFADPDVFDPDRFSEQRAEHKTPGAFVPFGVGTHTCAGRGMAEGLLTLDAALLLHRRRFAGDPHYALRQVARPTPSPDNGLRIEVLGRRGS